jgi:hypothetical protein
MALSEHTSARKEQVVRAGNWQRVNSAALKTSRVLGRFGSGWKSPRVVLPVQHAGVPNLPNLRSTDPSNRASQARLGSVTCGEATGATRG